MRVVLDFKDVKEHSVFYMPNPTRLVIDVKGTAAPKMASAAPARMATGSAVGSVTPSVTPSASDREPPAAPLVSPSPYAPPERGVDLAANDSDAEPYAPGIAPAAPRPTPAPASPVAQASPSPLPTPSPVESPAGKHDKKDKHDKHDKASASPAPAPAPTPPASLTRRTTRRRPVARRAVALGAAPGQPHGLLQPGPPARPRSPPHRHRRGPRRPRPRHHRPRRPAGEGPGPGRGAAPRRSWCATSWAPTW